MPGTAMTTTSAMQWETVGTAVVAIRTLLMRWMGRLLAAASNEGGQPLAVSISFRSARSRLARLLLPLLIGLGITRHVGLGFTRSVRSVYAPLRRIVLAIIEASSLTRAALCLCAGELRIILPKLLLRYCDHPVVVLGVLIVIFGRNVVAGRLRVARELNVFFGNMRWIAANFHVRSVGLEDARHGIVSLAMIIAAAHPLVLTVSHDWPAANSFA